MKVDIDTKTVAITVVNSALNKIGPEISLDKKYYSDVVNEIENMFTKDSDHLEEVLEGLLISEISQKVNMKIQSSYELFKIFGGLVNHD